MPGFTGSRATWFSLNGKTAEVTTGNKENRQVFDGYEGSLIGCEFREDEYEGKPTYQYIYKFLNDDGERENLVVSVGTIASSNLINCLASVGEEGYGRVTISPYLIDIGSRNVATVYVENDGAQLSWAVEPDDLPPVGKERNRFFHDMFEQIQKRLEAGAASGPPTDNVSTNGKSSEDPFGANEESNSQREVEEAVSSADDDLPF